MYLVLAGQYESWIAPATVIVSVPLALLGTAAALLALGVGNNLYTQIGLILLIALSSKNAILIVEFARELRIREGKDILEAAVEAARSRFRPILMTSFAFILGVVPLVRRQRRRRQRAEVDRHRGADRHARLDAADGRVRAVGVRRHAAARRVARPPQGEIRHRTHSAGSGALSLRCCETNVARNAKKFLLARPSPLAAGDDRHKIFAVLRRITDKIEPLAAELVRSTRVAMGEN